METTLTANTDEFGQPAVEVDDAVMVYMDEALGQTFTIAPFALPLIPLPAQAKFTGLAGELTAILVHEAALLHKVTLETVIGIGPHVGMLAAVQAQQPLAPLAHKVKGVVALKFIVKVAPIKVAGLVPPIYHV